VGSRRVRHRENAPCGRLWLILWAPVAVQRSYSYASRQIVSHHRNIQIYIVFCIIVNICLFHFGINRKAEGAEFCGVWRSVECVRSCDGKEVTTGWENRRLHGPTSPVARSYVTAPSFRGHLPGWTFQATDGFHNPPYVLPYPTLADKLSNLIY